MQSNVEDRKALSVEHDSPVSIVEQPLLVAYRAAPNEPTSQASSGSASVFSFSRIFNRTASGTGTSEHLIDSSSMSSPQRGYPQLASFPGESPIQIPLNTDDPVPERNNDLNLDLSGQRVPVPNHRSGRGEPLEGDTDFDPRAADKPPKPKKSKQRSAQRAPFSPSGEDAEMAAKRDASLRDIIQHLDTSGRPGRQGSEEKFADDNEDGFKKPERDVLVPLELNTVHGRDGIGKMSPSHEGGTWASVAAWKVS